MIVQLVEQFPVLHEELPEPGAVVGAELRQRFLSGARLDLTHMNSYRRVPDGSSTTVAEEMPHLLLSADPKQGQSIHDMVEGK